MGASDGRVKQQACLSLYAIINLLPSQQHRAHSTEEGGEENVDGEMATGQMLIMLSSAVKSHGKELGVLEACSRAILLHLVRTAIPDLRPLAWHDAFETASNLVFAVATLLDRPPRDILWNTVATLLQTLALLASVPGATTAVFAAQGVDAAYTVLLLVGATQKGRRHADSGDLGPNINNNLHGFGGKRDGDSGGEGGAGDRKEDVSGTLCGTRQMVIESACRVLWVLGGTNHTVNTLAFTRKCFWACATSNASPTIHQVQIHLSAHDSTGHRDGDRKSTDAFGADADEDVVKELMDIGEESEGWTSFARHNHEQEVGLHLNNLHLVFLMLHTVNFALPCCILFFEMTNHTLGSPGTLGPRCPLLFIRRRTP